MSRVVSIGKDENIAKVKDKVKNIKSVKAFPAKRFMGRLKLVDNPILYQKQVREEWDESSR